MSLNINHDYRPKTDHIRVLQKKKEAMRRDLSLTMHEWTASDHADNEHSEQLSNVHSDDARLGNMREKDLRGGINGTAIHTPLIPTEILSDLYIERQINGILLCLRSIVQQQINEKHNDDDYIQRADALWETHDDNSMRHSNTLGKAHTQSSLHDNEHMQQMSHDRRREMRRYVNIALKLFD
jgi:hypothetical protein